MALLFLALAAVTGYVYSIARHELPQVEGRVVLNGLSGPVTIIRDKLGVPHIRAASFDDLFYAQGFVTAQDRLWQMDVTRRYTAGDLAEIFGPALLKHDRQQRYLQFREACRRAAASLDPQQRHYLEVYARGVNALIERTRDHLPLEFRLLRYSPAPWTVEDSMLLGANMSQMLNTQYPLELKREAVIRHLNPQEIADLYPSTSWRDLPPAQQAKPSLEEQTAPKSDSDGDQEEDRVPTQTSSMLALFQPAKCDECVPGSNNWVVSGEHTVSGRPLLSNDMHLAHSIPDLWYEAHLTKGDGQDLDVAGVTLPGLPFVIVGHNRRIAWGFTNLAPDVQDLFVEQFNDAGDVATPQGWQSPQKVHEVIHVKGRPDDVFDVIVTRHGPVITPILKGETRQLALQWTIYDPAIITSPFLEMNSARNWQEFRAALSKFASPAQNAVYADINGHIGYQATGKIPIRASGDGLLPQSGADAAHDWIGYVPFDQLPSVYDPPSGILATANGRITPDGYRHLLANIVWAPYRTARIFHLLKGADQFSAADMLFIQTDVTSELERFFSDRFVYAIDHSKKVSPRVHQAAEIMRGWDGRMDKDSAAASIAYWSRRNLIRLLLLPKLGDDYINYDWGLSAPALENIVTHRFPRWLPQGYSSYDDVLVAAVQKAVDSERAPRDLKRWYWGKQFPVEVQHPVFGAIPILKYFSGTGSHWQSGSGSTVKQVGSDFGPSERLTVDFSNFDHSTLNIVIGQSGHLLSPHYQDQFPAWYNDSSFQFPFTEAAVNAAAEHRLTLEPH
ncbi:MAG TPA: penicillin acylase family protein [Terriglobales bacterium]|nr:penicillin acylase family protein [Terriglobales bacterium]